MINHRKVPYEISIGQRIAQIIFHKVERLVLWKPTHCQNQKDNVVVLVQLTTKLYKIFSFSVLTKKNMSSIEADQSNKLFMIAIK